MFLFLICSSRRVLAKILNMQDKQYWQLRRKIIGCGARRHSPKAGQNFAHKKL